jgi:2-polyprenyl-6-methoxyphenol hydroxylase-like FAD-dependent oxidoreductase
MEEKTIATSCCIAGGGPAGIMLGYMLARAGIDVVVLEKWPDFFRDFRGDTIHPSTMEVLHELGLLEEFLKLPHNETQIMAGHVGSEEIEVADFGRLHVRSPFIAFIPQWDFLTFISGKAKAYPGFHLMMETEAIDILEEKGKVVGVRAKNKEGEFDIRAALTVGADGRHSTIREKSKLEVEEFGAPIDVLWFRLSRKEDGTQRSLGYVDNGKILIMLDRDEYWQCGFIINKGDFERIKAKGLEEFRKSIEELVPVLVSSVGELTDWEQVKLLSVTVDHLTEWFREGLLCIGDSAHAMSPVGGVGINFAIQDAVAAANVLVPAFRKGRVEKFELTSIQMRREFPTRLMQHLQVFIHRKVVAAALRQQGHITRMPWLLDLIHRFPILQYFPARIIGIGFRAEHVKIEF